MGFCQESYSRAGHFQSSFSKDLSCDVVFELEMFCGRPQVSQKGTPDALFAECLDGIRRRRYELDPDVDNRPSAAIEKLTQEERAIAAKIFERVDPERKVSACSRPHQSRCLQSG